MKVTAENRMLKAYHFYLIRLVLRILCHVFKPFLFSIFTKFINNNMNFVSFAFSKHFNFYDVWHKASLLKNIRWNKYSFLSPAIAKNVYEVWQTPRRVKIANCTIKPGIFLSWDYIKQILNNLPSNFETSHL